MNVCINFFWEFFLNCIRSVADAKFTPVKKHSVALRTSPIICKKPVTCKKIAYVIQRIASLRYPCDDTSAAAPKLLSSLFCSTSVVINITVNNSACGEASNNSMLCRVRKVMILACALAMT